MGKVNPADSLAALSPNRNLIVTVHDGALRLWSNQNGNFIVTIAERLASPFEECKFSLDGKSILGNFFISHVSFLISNINLA